MRKIILALLLLYVASPIDLIPDFIRPIGLLDDAVALWAFYQIWKNPTFLQKIISFIFNPKDQPPPNHDASESYSTSKQTPWEILGVSKNATIEEIKTAYRQRSQEYHPDKVQHLGSDLRDLADKKFREIQQAFDALTR